MTTDAAELDAAGPSAEGKLATNGWNESQGGRMGRRTRVMSNVARSISRSSALRSVKAGRMCFECSLSSVATIVSSASEWRRRTLNFDALEYVLDLVGLVDPAVSVALGA